MTKRTVTQVLKQKQKNKKGFVETTGKLDYERLAVWRNEVEK